MGREETTVDLKKLGKKPQYAICQFCHARALTRLERYVEEGGINGLMLFFCCCYPITVYRLFYGKDIAYYCGSCNRVMAKRMRIDGEIRVVEPTTGRETKVAPDQDQHFDDST